MRMTASASGRLVRSTMRSALRGRCAPYLSRNWNRAWNNPGNPSIYRTIRSKLRTTGRPHRRPRKVKLDTSLFRMASLLGGPHRRLLIRCAGNWDLRNLRMSGSGRFVARLRWPGVFADALAKVPTARRCKGGGLGHFLAGQVGYGGNPLDCAT